MAALSAVVAPFIVSAVSGAYRLVLNRRDHITNEWKRLHELTAILYNRDHQAGSWDQLLAAKELKQIKTRQAEAKEIAFFAADYFSNSSQTDAISVELLKALQNFSKR